MHVYGIIPARYKSTRLEAKPLADIHGKPMFWHVYTQAAKANLTSVFLATDDIRIDEAAKALNIPSVMTADTHNSGSDRICEAADILAGQGLEINDDSIIINIQGDEPLLKPEMLNELIQPFIESPEVQITTLAHKLDKIKDKETFLSPNTVKIVLDKNNKALYFSRLPIPYTRDIIQENIPENNIFYAHVGIYAFRYSALKTCTSLKPSLLENTEKLEQLRFLENSIPIHVVTTTHFSIGVDTFEDLEKVRALISAS